jgi:hypothetical protein
VPRPGKAKPLRSPEENLHPPGSIFSWSLALRRNTNLCPPLETDNLFPLKSLK